ncbi:uncharacterized protein LOC131642077 [Vicia villosa]|uniref:uncharacterized protein LOC131642077 n=1 Tax=Vicia villosa TaxID=3911 RepID=UPI00273B781B|nr:uncharacterized protein LOC131642077 [Vicia villosa]
MNNSLAQSYWGNGEVMWSAKNSIGMSGGMLLLWNPAIIEAQVSFEGDGFVGIQALWRGTCIYFVNIYSACTIHSKRKLWSDLVNLKSSFPSGYWCVGGDFNAIKRSSERKGNRARFIHSEMQEFDKFICDMDLVDPPAFGNKFTCFSCARDSMSRLDRFILSEGLIDLWGIKGQFVENRSIMDHCPIAIRASVLNWGPKPFKFFTAWTKHPSFLPLVKEVWSSSVIQGRKIFCFKEKLKILKARLRVWNAEVFGMQDFQIDLAFKELSDSDLLAAAVLDDVTVSNFQENRKEVYTRVWDRLLERESFIRQKSRCRWLKEGDRNSKFFHSFMKLRFRRNAIIGFKQGAEMVEDVVGVKSVAVEHFKDRFQEKLINRPVLDGVTFNELLPMEAASLEEPFTMQDIKEVVEGFASFAEYVGG